MLEQTKGIIFNIQRFSIHDGPGIRTVVFLKGCPLRCKWCGNPESQRFQPELAWNADDCIACKGCQQLACADCKFQDGILSWEMRGTADREETRRVCPTQALRVIGEEMTAAQVVAEIQRDQVFYSQGEGGLTLSGGEPLSQPEFSLAILETAQAAGLHCAIETTNFAPWETVSRLAASLDYYLTDVKCIDDGVHLAWTGVSNRLILENLRRLRAAYPALPILVRTPVIPDVNDSEEALSGIAAFLNALRPGKALQWELLKYHRLGLPKYASLRRCYEMGAAELSEERFQWLRRRARSFFANTV